MRLSLVGAIAAALLPTGASGSAQTREAGGVRFPGPGSSVPSSASGRLLLTGGATMSEGASGGGRVHTGGTMRDFHRDLQINQAQFSAPMSRDTITR
jgi:hypothetical protein